MAKQNTDSLFSMMQNNTLSEISQFWPRWRLPIPQLCKRPGTEQKLSTEVYVRASDPGVLLP